MAKLQTMEKVVLQVLEEVPEARKDDHMLMYSVCRKLNKELLTYTFGAVMYHHAGFGLPNWETVTRCRRKLQAKFPYLKDPEMAVIRDKEQEEYREYAKT